MMATETRSSPAARPAAPPAADPAADERRLVVAILQRDRKATAEFVARYTDPVYAYVKRRLAPRADLVDDLVQEVFLAALGGLAGFRGTSSLRSWLLGIARHKVEDCYRERLREADRLPDDEQGEPVDGAVSVDERLGRAQLAQRAHQVLARLPEPYGLVLLWRYWENRSVREIAGATDRTEKAVERLLARARARFRELWER